MSIIDVIAKQARFVPEEPAFVEVRPVSKVRRELSWGEFGDRTNRLANSLLARGAKKGEKVFILGKNSLGWLEAYFARHGDGRVGDSRSISGSPMMISVSAQRPRSRWSSSSTRNTRTAYRSFARTCPRCAPMW